MKLGGFTRLPTFGMAAHGNFRHLVSILCCAIVIFRFIFLAADDASRGLACHLYVFLGVVSIQLSYPFFPPNGLFDFLRLSCEVLCIGWIRVFCQVGNLQIFPPSSGLAFVLMTVSVKGLVVLVLIQVQSSGSSLIWTFQLTPLLAWVCAGSWSTNIQAAKESINLVSERPLEVLMYSI